MGERCLVYKGEGEGGHIQIWLAVKDIRSAVRSGGGMVEEGGD